tara:strand:+ start:7676 stop:8278 length:603 start_codon:yes stop_codon:yes gene_type:complete
MDEIQPNTLTNVFFKTRIFLRSKNSVSFLRLAGDRLIMEKFLNCLSKCVTFTPKKRVLLNYLYFYHVTPLDNVESIQSSGLDPERTSVPNLHGPSSYRENYSCLTTEAGISKVIRLMDDGMGGMPDLALLRISSRKLIKYEFDIDQTHDQIRNEVEGDEYATADEIHKLLHNYHYLLVFKETIPGKYFSKIPIEDYLNQL